ncbi:hypothetical protein [Pontibacter korlensis]|uniref:hypothetical protein n=1 Tax=Pontibacter korlensis TaxID=400092 RepID=UPI0011DE0AB3|nr:hypothetical protein [Pontibacter korlensis]
MIERKRKSSKPSYTSKLIQPKKVLVMRNNQKVARVSLYCKLNMLVPQLQNLSARMKAEAAEKNRKGSK